MSLCTLHPARLQEAIERVPAAREKNLCATAKVASGALKSALTKLAELPSQSVLSDMLSGRAPGQRYQARLAELLGVDLRWLHGDDRFPPAWRLSPLLAFERLAHQLALAWMRSRGARNGMASGNRRHWPPVASTYQHQIAHAISQPLGSPDVMHLAAGRFEEVPIPVLLQLAAFVGMVVGDADLDRLEDGRLAARAVERRVAQRLDEERLERDRLLAGGACARVIRLGLQLVKTQRRYQAKDLSVVNAAQHVIWHQILTRTGRALRPLPDDCAEELGSAELLDLESLQEHLSEKDPADELHSDDDHVARLRGSSLRGRSSASIDMDAG